MVENQILKIRYAEEKKLIRNWMLGADHVTFYALGGRYYMEMLNNVFEIELTHGVWTWFNIEGEDDVFTIHEYVDGADEIMNWVANWLEQLGWRGGEPPLEES